MSHPVVSTDRNQFTIVQGEARQLPVALILSNKDYKPFSIVGHTEIVARFLDKDSSYLELKESLSEIFVVDATTGRIAIDFDSTRSYDLKTGDRQSFEVVVTFSDGTVRIAQIRDRLNVKPRLSRGGP